MTDPTGGHAGPIEWAAKAIAGACVFLAAMLAAGRAWIRREARHVADEQIVAHNGDEDAHPAAIEKATGPVMTVLERIETKLNRLEIKVTKLATSHDILTGGGTRSCVEDDSGDAMPAFGDVPFTRRATDPDDLDPRTMRRGSGIRGRG